MPFRRAAVAATAPWSITALHARVIAPFLAQFAPLVDVEYYRTTPLDMVLGLIVKCAVSAYGALLCASIVSARARRGVRKIHAGARANAHLVLSSEKKWSKDNQSRVFGDGWHVRKTKTIVFIRHGESTWNEVFNRGFFSGLTMPVRIVIGVACEVLKFFSDDSYFLDSPLSAKGAAQATELREFFTKERALREAGVGDRQSDIVDIIVGVRGRSVIVSSNLRRAVNTTVHALWCRLRSKSEKVVIHSALQEMARNVDTYALASGRGEIVPTQHLAKELGLDEFDASAIMDASANAGQKSLNRKGVNSLREFAAWSMNESADVIIAGGHSIWFREFFKHFLPSDSLCEGKKKKIVNCGVVAFDLQFGTHPEHGEMYAIDSASVRVVRGGFGK